MRLIVLFLMGGTGLLLKAGVARGAEEKEIRLGILPNCGRASLHHHLR